DPVVEAACVDVLYQATPSLVANLACAIVLAAAAYQVIPHLYLFAWLIAVVFIGIGRFPLKRAYQSRDVAPAEAVRWGYYFSVGSFLSGLAWGVVVILVLRTDSVLLHAMAIVFVAGLVAGAATSAASFLPAYYAFMVSPLVCTIGFLLWMQQRDYFVLALMTLLFAAMVTSIARRMNGSLKSAYALRLKNDALVEDLQRALERVGVANRAKSDFLANMRHELRTPLNAIIGFSGMILSQSQGPIGSPKYVEYAHDIRESGSLLLGLISDILDVSKIEAGQLELHKSEIDIERAIRSCIMLIKDKAYDGQVKLTVEIDNDLPVLFADEMKFKQILINLVSNSVKFTRPGGLVSIGVSYDRRGGYAVVVTDTGIGIARENIPQALAAFRQIEGDRVGKNEGSGLGLSLAKSLTELHGGILELESKVGVGTTVVVRFPVDGVVRSDLTTGDIFGFADPEGHASDPFH
ncbi:MAG: HAMP domain-containing sensor histidine kinase, partial [Alphaproteobacteria bacterium]|nr:HAMP domain-containing sensor histidine kinase [Alphaproteobacteria bacterium]